MNKSATYYESVGDRLMQRGDFAAASRAYDHACRDCCLDTARGNNILPDYCRLTHKYECAKRLRSVFEQS